MAKEIKALKCPQCGATDQKEVKPGFYRCGRCQTEYFLDDDTVTVTHLHQWVAPAPAPPVPVRRIVLALGVLTALGVGLSAAWHTGTPPDARPTFSADSVPPEKPAADSNAFAWSSVRSVPLVAGGKRPGTEHDAKAAPTRAVVLVVGQRTYKKEGFSNDADPRNGLYATLYDPLTGAETRTQRLGAAPAASARRSFSPDLDLRVFSNGATYFTVDDSQIYEVDPATLTARDVTTQLFARQAALAAGVATLKFNQERWGDGLELLVNDGRKFHYYPLIDQLYDEDVWYRATHAFGRPGPRAAPRTYYTFTGRSMEYPDAPAQLLEIRYLANPGGPEYKLENPSWSDNYGGSGFFTDRDPHTKELIGANEKKTSRILSFRDLTPGRRYFDPDVRYADATVVLITLRTTAAPEAPFRLQCLDPTTGAIRWTTPLGEDDETAQLVRFADGFIATDGDGCTVYGADGKVRRSFGLKYQPVPTPGRPAPATGT
ncbi:MAG: hypothetical protein H7330_00855 [Hymenobacteraceae bacterium]|nr:hypothetical protein [Hymenobacteraceae bacterium]